MDLWFILDAQTKKHHVEFFKVKGHADHPQNNRCDELARAAIEEYRRIYDSPEQTAEKKADSEAKTVSSVQKTAQTIDNPKTI